jgi:hypothetical protein
LTLRVSEREGVLAMDLLLSADTRTTAGVLLLTIVAVEWGGVFMLKIVRGKQPMTDLQKAFARAGHAHAGVLVSLALVCQILADAAEMSGALELFGRSFIPLAAILFPAGFFFSSMGAGRTQPNGLIVLLYAGGVCLGLGAVSLGVGLLASR